MDAYNDRSGHWSDRPTGTQYVSITYAKLSHETFFGPRLKDQYKGQDAIRARVVIHLCGMHNVLHRYFSAIAMERCFGTNRGGPLKLIWS